MIIIGIIITYLIIGFIALNYPKLLVPILILLMPLERFNSYIGFTLDPIVMFFPVIIMSIWINYHNIFKYAKTMNKYLKIGLIAIPVTILISDFFSINKFLSFKSTIYIVLSILLFLICYMYTLYYKNTFTIIITFFITAFLVSFYGILQFLGYLFYKVDSLNLHNILHSTTINPSTFILHIGQFSILRPDSTFNDVNTTAGFIAIFLPILLILYFLNRKNLGLKAKRWLLVLNLLSLIIFFFFITTFSKSSLIGIAIAFFLLLLYYYKTYRNKYILYTLSIYFIIVVVSSIIVFPYIYSAQKYSFDTHILLLQSSISIFKKFPIFGTGLGTFTYYFGLYIKPFIPFYYNNIDTPPLFTLWLSEIGIVGFLSYIYFLVVYFSIFWKKLKVIINNKRDIDFIIVSAFISGLLALLIANLFHSYFDLFFNWIVMGTFLAILEKATKKSILNNN
ncbi:MAG: O-antigen ligase family protein [Patescibacteria group bacterium]